MSCFNKSQNEEENDEEEEDEDNGKEEDDDDDETHDGHSVSVLLLVSAGMV